MSTNVKELIEFLNQFPDDSKIYVLKEVQSAWSISTQVVELNLDSVEVLDFRDNQYVKDCNDVEIRLIGG